MSMEKLVRPFQTREITPPKFVATKVGAGSTEPVTLTIGKNWNIKSFNCHETLDITFYMEKKMKEKKQDSQGGQEGGGGE